jgi:hypothetical protein
MSVVIMCTWFIDRRMLSNGATPSVDVPLSTSSESLPKHSKYQPASSFLAG